MDKTQKKLLKTIYNRFQRNKRAVMIEVAYNPESGQQNPGEDYYDRLNFDIEYLIESGYVAVKSQGLIYYVLTPTKEGSQLVENDFQNPAIPQSSNFNFSGANIQNSVVGQNATASGSSYVINIGASLEELRLAIQSKPEADQEQLNELLEALHRIEESGEPVPRGILSRFADAIGKNADLLKSIGGFFCGLFGLGG